MKGRITARKEKTATTSSGLIQSWELGTSSVSTKSVQSSKDLGYPLLPSQAICRELDQNWNQWNSNYTHKGCWCCRQKLELPPQGRSPLLPLWKYPNPLPLSTPHISPQSSPQWRVGICNVIWTLGREKFFCVYRSLWVEWKHSIWGGEVDISAIHCDSSESPISLETSLVILFFVKWLRDFNK